VQVEVDGQDCHNTFIKQPDSFDVIMMDMQMPLVDGSAATRLIREFEDSTNQQSKRRRIPIIAVSASLAERRRHEYVKDGFDGWILKPIDFKRLEAILAAAKDESMREDLLCVEGKWDKGGWLRGKEDMGSALERP